ncbi:MAG: phosphatidate cytidylyltransferase [Bacteriovorax sp.]|nr:phosphatidate cytidylyltransferase [Bacteriovorax sp.]
MLSLLAIGEQTQISIITIFSLIMFFTLLFYGWDYFWPREFLHVLKQRVNSWWIIFIIVLIMIGTKREVLFFMMALISLISFRELTSKLNFNTSHRKTLLIAYIAIPIQYYFAYSKFFIAFLTFIPVGMLVLLPFRSILEDLSKESIKTFSQLHWALMLTVFSLSHISYIASLPNVESLKEGSPGMIFFLIVITQLNDVAQFVSGKLFGKRKISPLISPNKTWAGLIGGVLGSVMFGYVFRNLLPLTTLQVMLLSMLIAIAGFFGDLNISAIKRDLKIKDMGDLIPGHGGILDRMDSLIFSNLVFFYLTYYWIYS